MAKAIGGYFGLDLHRGGHYHATALKLNLGRSALRLVARTEALARIHVPFYLCRSVGDALEREGVRICRYELDGDFAPRLENRPASGEAVLLVDYFGICGRLVRALASRFATAIVDNTQAFFAEPSGTLATFYSARKFFGVPDGAFLYRQGAGRNAIPALRRQRSHGLCGHLLERVDMGASFGYKTFLSNEMTLAAQPVLRMSRLADGLLRSVDYAAVRTARRRNFQYLHRHLAESNELTPNLDSESVPMSYPWLNSAPGVRESLLEEHIYVPQYWREVLDTAPKASFDRYLAEHLIALPIDQRYTLRDMQRVVRALGRALG